MRNEKNKVAPLVNNTVTEGYIQQQCYIWFNNNYCLKTNKPQMIMFSVPNEMAMSIRGALMYKGYSSKVIDNVINPSIKRMKSIGMTSGVSDTIVVLPNKTLYIEFKTSTGVQSSDQLQFQSIVTQLGHQYHICRSLEQFKTIIHENLKP